MAAMKVGYRTDKDSMKLLIKTLKDTVKAAMVNMRQGLFYSNIYSDAFYFGDQFYF